MVTCAHLAEYNLIIFYILCVMVLLFESDTGNTEGCTWLGIRHWKDGRWSTCERSWPCRHSAEGYEDWRHGRESGLSQLRWMWVDHICVPTVWCGRWDTQMNSLFTLEWPDLLPFVATRNHARTCGAIWHRSAQHCSAFAVNESWVSSLCRLFCCELDCTCSVITIYCLCYAIF